MQLEKLLQRAGDTDRVCGKGSLSAYPVAAIPTALVECPVHHTIVKSAHHRQVSTPSSSGRVCALAGAAEISYRDFGSIPAKPDAPPPPREEAEGRAARDVYSGLYNLGALAPALEKPKGPNAHMRSRTSFLNKKVFFKQILNIYLKKEP